MNKDYFVVDAFTSERFRGNPAAVLLDARGMTDQQMQAVANEFNLSETTFILPPTDASESAPDPTGAPPALSLRFRWFTPTSEVKMCGHATIGGVHALVESGRLRFPEEESVVVRIETLSGVLTAYVERVPGKETDTMIWLDMVDPTFAPLPAPATDLASLLALSDDAMDESLPIVQTQDQDVLAFARDFQTLNEAKPDFGRLAALLTRHGLRGLCLATVKTLTPSITVQSRFFAPSVGIDEDPVTGSVHGPLAAYLVMHGRTPLHDGLAALTCTQGISGGRAGLVHALVQPKGDDRFAVRLGGQAVTTMRGTLTL
ncbi:MAG: PhzF family phenazine biosynthesis protein [Phycisphaerae bacterium]|jgi:PhzF family phenazine biosynthesis protein